MVKPNSQTTAVAVQVMIAVAVAFALFQLYTAFFGILASYLQRLVHVCFALTLIFLVSQSKGKLRFIDYALAATCVGIAIYGMIIYPQLWLRSGMATPTDLVVGGILTLVLLEGTRRSIGWFLPALAALFLFYGLFGNYFPPPLTTIPHDVQRVVGDLFITTNGIFGVPAGVSSTVVAIFIIFAAFLREFGGGQAFIDLARAWFGFLRGGPAKIAIVASGFMGMVSGSAVANVAATGAFTIPLMKQIGFKPRFAGAVEAAASTGGQLMPPIMGAAAFIMAEFLAIPYVEIIIAAVIPAFLYYIVLFLFIDHEAVLQGIKGLPRSELPNGRKVLRQTWYLFIPLGVLIWALVIARYSPMFSASWSLIAVVGIAVLTMLPRRKVMGFLKTLLAALQAAGRSMLPVALACACAGVIIGMVMLTGLGLKLSAMLITLSGGNLGFLLALTALASLILGMGLPTSACYIILAILVGPALTQPPFEVPPLAAHFFVFYVGLMANVTPPVAIAAYTGAGIAGSEPFRTGVTAFRLCLSGFLIPFFFVLRPELLLIDATVTGVLFAVLLIGTALFAMVIALSGYVFRRGTIGIVPRIILGIGAISLIVPDTMATIVGFGAIIAGFALIFITGAVREKGRVI